jgi:hypothetical protein
MTYPPQGGYPDRNDGQQQPQSYELYEQPQPQPSAPQSPYGAPGGYGWGQAPQSPAAPYASPPAAGYPPGYVPQPSAPPPRRTNLGVVSAVVIGGLVLVLGTILVLVFSSRDGGDGPGGDGDDKSSAAAVESPTEVVEAYYKANKDRDWDKALSYLNDDLYKEFSGVSDDERETAADQYEDVVYTVTGEKIAEDGKTADVDVSYTWEGSSYDVVLKMEKSGDEWKIAEFQT